MTSARDVVEAGYIRPRRRADELLRRIDEMVEGVVELLGRFTPTDVVLEVPSGRPGAGYYAGAKARLALYGMAVGEIRRACLSAGARANVKGTTRVPRLSCPTERDWTRGRSKPRRRKIAASSFPGYYRAARSDSGGDVADALLLGAWWYEQRATLGGLE